ncbi:MAG: glycosyltransferase family 9 protein [Deferrisomatales bacterium]|nr:glycosyltransferase family 9 protein [Deferrisomatales bacterium]
MNSPPTNLLVIQLRQIGDVVLTTPIPHILKAAWPGCRVTFLTERPSDQLLGGNPYIDEVLVSNRKGTWRDTLQLAAELRERRFDYVLDFMANPRSAILSFLSGARARVSCQGGVRGVFYTLRVKPKDGYASEYKSSVLVSIGIESEWNRPEIFLTVAEKLGALALRDHLLKPGANRLVTVDPSHRRATRRWPARHYGELCAALYGRLGALPVVLWGPGEEALAEEVVGASEGTALKAPLTALREMAALIGAADLHVGNCSAPRHIAVAVGTPSFTVLGATSSGWTHPATEHADLALGLSCQPCNSNTCERGFACLEDLAAERVFGELSAWANSCLGWRGP